MKVQSMYEDVHADLENCMPCHSEQTLSISGQ